ncbi:hypothetical protein NQ318_006120 [Aromia moschata]|uniref:C2H2-type domain-containing protein n=1 Tax=Aromia moschata TaxID=1265417 RepID=A0AAV8Z3Y5_9CUCU|nr:hypothetical protein NQ318_006120 [Aromia moschata]
MLLPARCERVVTSLNRTVSGDTFPTPSSLDKPGGRSGTRFESVKAVKAKATEVLNQLTEADFQHCFQQWKRRMERYKPSLNLDDLPPQLLLPMLLRKKIKRDSSLVVTKIKQVTPSSDRSPVSCPDCGRRYKLKSSLRNHRKWECGKDPQFPCPYCSYKAKQKMHVTRHIERMHTVIDYSDVMDQSLQVIID